MRNFTCPICEGFVVGKGGGGTKTCGSKACRDEYGVRRGTRLERKCLTCGLPFVSYKSADKKYCSVKCFSASGKFKRHNVRRHMKDYNHDEIVAALEKLGVRCYDMSHMGGGFPDLLCNVHRETHLVEVKNPDTRYGRAGLNDLQIEFADNWNGAPIYIISTLGEVEAFANGRFDEVPSYGGFVAK